MRAALVAVVVLAAGLASAGPAAAASRPPLPGFGAKVGRTGVECSVHRHVLRCLNSGGRLPAGASCSFGGAVPEVAARRSGRARLGFACIDEAYHDWPRLRRGRGWRHGSFRCFHGRRELRCSNRTDSFRIGRRGGVRGAA